MKLWGGRFTKSTSSFTDHFHSSISFDQRLYKEDITGSIAHAAMLGKQGIISNEDANLIQKTLKEMKIPLCVVWGKQNKYNTSEQMETIQNIRPHDTYFLFENTRMLPHFENSEVFNESIHSFLQ